MSLNITFLTGFVYGAALLLTTIAIFQKRDEKRMLGDKKRKELMEEEDRKKKDIKNLKRAIDHESKTLKRFKLGCIDQPYSAYLDTDVAFIAFHLEYLSHPSSPQVEEGKVINLNNVDYRDADEDMFIRLLEEGKAMVFSKVEGKLVDEIMREDVGRYMHADAGQSIPFSYEYCLPDGTLLFTKWNIILDQTR